MLSGAIGWVGKQVQLNASPVSLGEGWQLITQAITEQQTEPRGPRHPRSIPPTSSPFNFHNQDQPTQVARFPTATEHWKIPNHDLGLSHQE